MAHLHDPQVMAPSGKHTNASRVKNPTGRPRPGRGKVVLIGNYRPAVTAIRQLHKAGRKTLLVSEAGNRCADASRYLESCVFLPPSSSISEGLRLQLPDILASDPEIDCVLPLTEESINAIAELRPQLPEHVHIASPAADTVALCHDKFSWLDFISGLDLACPEYKVAHDRDEFAASVERLGFPIVVRPVESGKRVGTRKAVTLFDTGDAAKLSENWPEDLNGLLLQKKVGGIRHNIFFAARHGEIICEQYSLSYRTDRFDGSGSTTASRTIAANPEMSSQLAAAARAMNYHGIGCAQFLGDRNGNVTNFLEINPRFGATYVVIEAAGMQFTRLTCELADPDCDVEWAKAWQGDTGTHAIWASGDLQGMMYSLRHGDMTLSQAARWFAGTIWLALTADTHSIWSWRDPMPLLTFLFFKSGNQLKLTRTSRKSGYTEYRRGKSAAE